jgi:hypothetical protein
LSIINSMAMRIEEGDRCRLLRASVSPTRPHMKSRLLSLLSGARTIRKSSKRRPFPKRHAGIAQTAFFAHPAQAGGEAVPAAWPERFYGSREVAAIHHSQGAG